MNKTSLPDRFRAVFVRETKRLCPYEPAFQWDFQIVRGVDFDRTRPQGERKGKNQRKEKEKERRGSREIKRKRNRNARGGREEKRREREGMGG